MLICCLGNIYYYYQCWKRDVIRILINRKLKNSIYLKKWHFISLLISLSGTALLPATPRQTWELRKDLICGFQLSLQYQHAWPSLRQTHTAFCAHLHLSVDHQLPDRQAAASEAGKTRIQNSHNQHWRPSGMCSLPTALLPLHQWLHFTGPLCQAPEVCGRHYSRRPHQGWRRVCLQTGGGAAGCMVQS